MTVAIAAPWDLPQSAGGMEKGKRFTLDQAWKPFMRRP
jgi:hypothetical protein